MFKSIIQKMLERIKRIDKEYLIVAGLWLASEVGHFTMLSYTAAAVVASYLIFKVVSDEGR